MRTFVKFTILAFAALAVVSACNSTPKFTNFSDAIGKEWQLTEIRTDPGTIIFDRNTLKTEGFSNIFTLNFDAERLSGVGAPNRYTAPYTADADQNISVQLIAGTMMAPLREPEKLKEQDYFTYIQNAYKWSFTKDGTLELSSKNADGTEVVLVYELGSAKK